jgi:hypothetical protein
VMVISRFSCLQFIQSSLMRMLSSQYSHSTSEWQNDREYIKFSHSKFLVDYNRFDALLHIEDR